jgi:hypothetical protein
MRRKLKIKIRQPGYILKNLDEELARKWNEQQHKI